MSKKKKKKKEKITYIDDGRPVSNLADLHRQSRMVKGNAKPGSTAGDKWKTYWSATKMMIKPMLITIGILCFAFFLLWATFSTAAM